VVKFVVITISNTIKKEENGPPKSKTNRIRLNFEKINQRFLIGIQIIIENTNRFD